MVRRILAMCVVTLAVASMACGSTNRESRAREVGVTSSVLSPAELEALLAEIQVFEEDIWHERPKTPEHRPIGRSGPLPPQSSAAAWA